MDPVISPDGKKMVWWNMKTDGFESEKHSLMIYDFETDKAEDYCTGFDQDATGFAWSEDGKSIYFISCKEATHQVYKLDVESRAIEQLTDGDYDYNTVLANGKQLIVTRTTHAEPSEIYAVQLNNKAVKQLSFINKDVLDKITPAKSEKRWVKTTDGKQMLVWVICRPTSTPRRSIRPCSTARAGPSRQ